MTAEENKLGCISPCFIVSDTPTAVRFYVEKLGFEVRFSEPADNPFFAIVGRELVQVFLKDSGTPRPNHTSHEWSPWDAFVYSPDPDELAAEFEGRGVTFKQPIRNRSDGVRGFEVADPDDYVLFFGCPIPELPESRRKSVA